MSRRKGLTPLQRAFIREYLVDVNATQAYIRAGGSARTANRSGPDLLLKPVVRKLVDAAISKRAAKVEVKADDILRELKLLAHSNMQDYVRLQAGEPITDFSKLSRDQWAAIQEITVDATGGTGDGQRKKIMRTRFKLASKGENLERLGRHLRLFGDNKLEVDLTGTVTIADRLRAARKR